MADPTSARRPTLAIETDRLFDGGGLIGPRRIEIVEGRISAVLEAGRSFDADETERLPSGVILSPGFIDVQVNGGGDALLNDDPSVSTVTRIVQAHRRFGTTGMLPTLITDHPDKMLTLADAGAAILEVPGVLGFHLEGPHINGLRKGIHPPQHIRPMTEADRRLISRFAGFGRSMVTLAPELVPAEVIACFAKAGLRVSAGHSEASAGEMIGAIDRGLSAVTHLFNAMSQMTAREPGVVGAALGDERLYAGIIPDGICVSPLNLRIAYRSVGPERLMLVTDAMPTAGGVRTTFRLQGRRISLQDGRLTDEGGTLAGAHLTMVEAVRNAVSMMGASLTDALAMASATPARFLGLDHERGRIAVGLKADLVAFDEDFSVRGVWLNGTRSG